MYLYDMETEARYFPSAMKLIDLYSHTENIPLYPLTCNHSIEEEILVVCEDNGCFCGCIYLLHHQNAILAIYMSSEDLYAIGKKRRTIRELLSAQYPDKKVSLDVKHQAK